jgi:hypothetical protein
MRIRACVWQRDTTLPKILFFWLMDDLLVVVADLMSLVITGADEDRGHLSSRRWSLWL